MKRAAVVVGVTLLATACSAGEGAPSTGTYTIDFPSTAAAVATDTVQILLFDPPATPADRDAYCGTLIQGRILKDPQKYTLQTPTVNICELLAGKKPITVPYGEHAAMAVAQRTGVDFMIGCTIQSFGDGDAPLPISLALIDVTNPVPATTCSTVSDFCGGICPAQ